MSDMKEHHTTPKTFSNSGYHTTGPVPVFNFNPPPQMPPSASFLARASKLTQKSKDEMVLSASNATLTQQLHQTQLTSVGQKGFLTPNTRK